MNSYLEEYLAKQDYQKITEQCVDWIRAWFSKNGSDSPAVIGISGGKDSSTVAALCVEALGRSRVIGVLMPDGIQPDIDVSKRLVQYLNIPNYEVNVHDGIYGVKNAVMSALEITELSKQVTTNLPPRIRMATQYALSQSLGGRVSNNSNASEIYVGYSTIFGDSAGDFSPLTHLTVSEVKLVARCLGLPQEFIEKAPSDGLSGHTDEDAFGFTYEQLDTYILTGYTESQEIKDKIDQRHKQNAFKRLPMPSFEF